MNEIKDIAMQIFTVYENKLCGCDAGHEICLSCQQCRVSYTPNTEHRTPNTALADFIDHTILKPDATTEDIINLCQQANEHKFKAICINPSHLKTAKQHIVPPVKAGGGRGGTPLLCTVVGFPLGANTPQIKLAETQQVIEDGAQEIDMVINISKLKDKQYKDILEEIQMLANTCHQADAILKVIIETCLLTREEIIIACLLAKKAGADFVKTSTGFSIKGAVSENVKLMRTTVGKYMGVKASGGIKTRQDALTMLSAGANRLGTSNSVSIVLSVES